MKPKQLIKSEIAARKAHRVICPALHPDTGVPYLVSTAYHVEGDGWSLGYHTGEDHACPVGSLAIATTWGTVVAAGPDTGYGSDYGTIVVIRKRDQKYDYMLCHLSKVLADVGQAVKPGTIVGLTGFSGNVVPSGPDGAHLHFEARPAAGHFGSDVDPMFVKQAGFQG